ncbi:MAG: NosD domain-containing protein, partial [Candidatus Heimdallarchaeota archaeon]
MNKGNLFILTIIIASLFSFPLILSTNNRTEMKTDNKSDLLVFPKFKYNRENLNPSTPIEIINDTDLLEQAKNSMWKGTGTKTDPVIIENLLFENFQPNLFNGSRVVEKLSYIKISNVKLNFLIQDNIITASHANVYGIHISDSENGIIRNNLLEYNEIPIFLSDSINFTIKNNVFFPKVVEPFRYFFSNIIDIQGVSNLNLYNNTLFNVGLNIERS